MSWTSVPPAATFSTCTPRQIAKTGTSRATASLRQRDLEAIALGRRLGRRVRRLAVQRRDRRRGRRSAAARRPSRTRAGSSPCSSTAARRRRASPTRRSRRRGARRDADTWFHQLPAPSPIPYPPIPYIRPAPHSP
jgi:hypothetical protein